MFTQNNNLISQSASLRGGSYDTMNYKMMANRQNNQNKNSFNSGYATYRSANNNKRNIPQNYEDNRSITQINLKNEHKI